MQLIFQDPFSSLNPHRTIKQIIAEPFIIHEILKKRSDINDRLTQLLELVNLSPDCLKKYPHELSGGQRQRVGIARAVVHKPKILLADEPTGNLDPALSAEIMALFRRFQSVGVTILIATHDINLINSLDHRIIHLEDGMLTDDGVRSHGQ